jgi:hypothetical protein
LIHQLLTTEYLFWLVAFLFYVLENVKLTKANEIIIVETLSLRLKPLISLNGFEFGGKEVNLLNPFTPFASFFRLQVDSNRSHKEGYLRTARRIALFESRILPFRTIGSIAFLYLVSGPVLTYYFGISGAFIILLPIHALCLMGALIFLLSLRRKLDLSYADIAAIYFELLLVPAYMAAITKKIANKQAFQCDGFYFSLQKSADLESTKYEVSRKIDLFASFYDESDSRSRDLKNYKSKLGLSDVEQ